MRDNIDYSLSAGYDKKTAAYMSTNRKKITNVTPNQDYTLTLTFDNGEQRIYDVSPLLTDGSVFAPFRDMDNFRRVYLDENHCVSWDIDPTVDSSIVWNNKVDLCSDGCYINSVPLCSDVNNT